MGRYHPRTEDPNDRDPAVVFSFVGIFLNESYIINYMKIVGAIFEIQIIYAICDS